MSMMAVWIRRRLGRQVNVRYEHDIGRGDGLHITMQQSVARLRCKNAVDKTVVLLHLSRVRLGIATLSPAHSGPARSDVRDVVSGRPRRLQHADAPINSVWQLSLMTGRNTIFEKDPTQSRVVAVERGFHPSLQLAWNTNARALRAHF